MFKTITASAVLFSVLCSSVFADTAECPATASIKQQQESMGYSYTAPGPGGSVWKGENPQAQAGDLATFKFTAAAYRAKSSQGNTDVVSCDFEGTAQDAFARMTLYSFKDWKAAQGSKWQEQAPKPDEVAYCNATKQAECVFDYSALVK
ncbi:MAG: hypothetical protein GAK37_03358 [Pseudomonas sp.]|nr:MAG: hypothetical protein GAK37_03358 [Pseudomonas sp.]